MKSISLLLYIEGALLIVFGVIGLIAQSFLLGGLLVLNGIRLLTYGRGLQRGGARDRAVLWFAFLTFVGAILFLSALLGSTTGWAFNPLWILPFIVFNAIPAMALQPQLHKWVAFLLYVEGISLLGVAWAALCSEYSYDAQANTVAAIFFALLAIYLVVLGRSVNRASVRAWKIAFRTLLTLVAGGILTLIPVSLTRGVYVQPTQVEILICLNAIPAVLLFLAQRNRQAAS